MTRTKLAPFYIILAGCLWGSMGLFVRRLGAMGLDSITGAAIILLGGAAVYRYRNPESEAAQSHKAQSDFPGLLRCFQHHLL